MRVKNRELKKEAEHKRNTCEFYTGKGTCNIRKLLCCWCCSGHKNKYESDI